MHEWPKDSEHLWSEWYVESRVMKYRVCVHPDCHEVQREEVKPV